MKTFFIRFCFIAVVLILVSSMPAGATPGKLEISGSTQAYMVKYLSDTEINILKKAVKLLNKSRELRQKIVETDNPKKLQEYITSFKEINKRHHEFFDSLSRMYKRLLKIGEPIGSRYKKLAREYGENLEDKQVKKKFKKVQSKVNEISELSSFIRATQGFVSEDNEELNDLIDKSRSKIYKKEEEKYREYYNSHSYSWFSWLRALFWNFIPFQIIIIPLGSITMIAVWGMDYYFKFGLTPIVYIVIFILCEILIHLLLIFG